MSRLIQVELWTDFISAGGVREAVVPLSQIFGASLNEDIRRAQRDLNLLVDAAISELLGGGTAPAAITLLRTASGEILKDDFNRPDSGTVGNGWSEFEANAGAWNIDSNTLFVPSQPNSSVNKLHRGSPTPVASMIIQSTFDDLQAFGGSAVHARTDPAQIGAPTSGPTISWNQGTSAGNYGFFVAPGPGAGGSFPCGQVVAAQPTFRNLRSALRDVGGSVVDARGYFVSASSLTDLSGTPALTQTCTGISTTNLPVTDDYGVAVQRSARHDMFFACGMDIIVTGLPTGFSIRLHGLGGPTAPEIGGVATLDPSGTRLPYSRLQVLNTAGTVVGTGLQPGAAPWPGDGWGGDLYTATVLSAGGFTPGGERKVIRTIFEGGRVDEFRIN